MQSEAMLCISEERSCKLAERYSFITLGTYLDISVEGFVIEAAAYSSVWMFGSRWWADQNIVSRVGFVDVPVNEELSVTNLYNLALNQRKRRW